MAAQWHLSGDYFENCNCSVVCPCLVSKAPPLTSRPTEGVCDVGVIFHIENGRYGDVPLDGLNVALAIHTPGPMGEGNWTVGAYIDERADVKQTEALNLTPQKVLPRKPWPECRCDWRVRNPNRTLTSLAGSLA